jgi:hypothetical protein
VCCVWLHWLLLLAYALAGVFYLAEIHLACLVVLFQSIGVDGLAGVLPRAYIKAAGVLLTLVVATMTN